MKSDRIYLLLSQKQCINGWKAGEIVGFGEGYYFILYDDDSKEQCTIEEIQQILRFIGHHS